MIDPTELSGLGWFSMSVLYRCLLLLAKKSAEGLCGTPKIGALLLRGSCPVAESLPGDAVATVFTCWIRGHEVILLCLWLLLEPTDRLSDVRTNLPLQRISGNDGLSLCEARQMQ